MSFKRITPADLTGKGNVGKPDTPGVSTAEMQRILDEIPREVIVPAFNALGDQLEASDAAVQLGAAIPGSPGELPENTKHTVQNVMEALLAYSRTHCQNRENPHEVTADQVGAYTREETEQAISDRVQQIGSADMTKAEYAGSAPGIVKAADNAKVFTALFRLDGWTQAPSGTWTQTADCAGMKASGNYSAPECWLSGNADTDRTLLASMARLNRAYMESMDGRLKAILKAAPPTSDVRIFVRASDGKEV